MFEVQINKTLVKFIEKLNEPNYTRIKEAILGLAEKPRPSGCLKLQGREAYRIRIGNYRIIYQIDDTIKIVSIVDIGHRKNVYQ